MVSRQNPTERPRSRPASVALMTGLPMGAGLALSAMLPVQLTLPVLSVVLIVSAVAVAGLSRLKSERADEGRLTYRDISGLLVFLGIAAGLLADPEDVLPILQRRASD